MIERLPGGDQPGDQVQPLEVPGRGAQHGHRAGALEIGPRRCAVEGAPIPIGGGVDDIV